MKTFEIEWKNDSGWSDTQEVIFSSYGALKEYIEEDIREGRDENLQVVSVREVVCKFEPIDWERI
jgi:hypothetical protein